MTREELAAALRKADAAGNADDARRLAGAIRQLDAGPAVQVPARPAMDPLHMVNPAARAQVQANQPMRSLPMSPLGPGNERYAPPKPPPQGDPLAPANPQAAAANVDAQQRARGLVPYTNASTGETYWRPDPARQVADANAQFRAREAAKASAAQAQAENEAFRNSRPEIVNQASDAIRGGFAATENAAFDAVDAGLDAIDPRRKVSQFISQNITPAAEQVGRGIGDFVEGPSGRFGGMAGPAVGAITGGLSELGATMARDPQDASTQIVDALEPTHMLARGVNTSGDALDAAMGGDFGRSGNLMAQAVPDLIGGSGVLPAMSVTANALRTAARAPQRELAEQLARIQPLPATGRVPMSAPRVAPTVAQTAPQAPTQPQTATAPPVPPIPPNAPAVTAGAAQPVPARSRAEQRADDLLIKKLAADGITMDDVRKIQARLARRGDSGVYETIGEIAALTDKSSGANLRGLQMAGGAAPGPLQEALVGLVNQNTEKLSPRLSRGATRATGQKADNAVATLDELETRLRTEATPAYDDAYATPVNPQVFANEILPVLNTPSGQKALQAARNNLASIAADLQGRAARGASERAMMESQRAQAAVKSIDDFMADPVRGTAIPTTMALDYTKRAFDDVIADAGFGSDTARIVGGTKRNFADSVSQATGGQYGNALGVFEDVKRLEDAFEVGTQALNKKTWELERELAKGRGGSPWTAGEVEALAMGVARNIEDLIEANNQSALTKLLKDKALKNMATALGSQKAADMFEETIRRLGANREWGRRVAGGSDTAMRQAAIRDAGMEGEDAITRVLDRVETSGNQFSLPGLVNDVAVKPIARTAKDIYQHLRYPGVYDEEVNRALIPLIGKPMTEGNLNEVIRRVEARMAEKGLIPPVQPAAVAAPPPAPRRRPRGPGGNPPGTTSSASATGTGIVAGGVLGAMAPADDENEQFINALFTAAGVGTAAGVAAKLAKGGKPPPASGKGAKPKAPPAKAPAASLQNAEKILADFRVARELSDEQLTPIADAINTEMRRLQNKTVEVNGERIRYSNTSEGYDRVMKLNGLLMNAFKSADGEIDIAKAMRWAEKNDPDRAVRVEAGRAVNDLQDGVRRPKPAATGVKPPPVKNGLPGGSRDLPMDEASRLGRAKEQGFDTGTRWYHGTARLDRLLEKPGIDPKRATSGPMPFFTDDPAMASSYAMGKKGDTSMPDYDVTQSFTVEPKHLGHTRGRTPYSVEQSWNFLAPEQKRTILERAKRVGWADPDTSSGPLKLHPEGVDASPSSSHFDWLMKTEARGNPITALRMMWHDGGILYGAEDQLKEVFKLAGYPHPVSTKNAPWTKAEGVLPVYMRMSKPLQTDNAAELQNVITQLRQDFARDRSVKKPYGADMWDKSTRHTPREWVEQLAEDVAKGENSFVWTSIPDKVTDALKRMGYDGILDTGGKMGGNGHRVAIPFSPTNVRSINAKFDPREMGSSKLLAGMSGNSRGIADNLKQDAALAAFGSAGGSFANQDDPQAGALGGMGIALAGKYGPGAVNALRGAGRVKPPPVRGASQGKFRGPSQQTFAGVNAKTADKVALARAQNMEAEGAGRDAIWDETGWFKGVDGKWRFEIDDSGARLSVGKARVDRAKALDAQSNTLEHASIIRHRAERRNISIEESRASLSAELRKPISDEAVALAKEKSPKELLDEIARIEALRAEKYPDTTVGQALEHPALFEAYPDIASRPYKETGIEGGLGFRGGYDDTADEFFGSRFDKPDAQRSTVLHELGHGIQQREGFAKGGSTSNVAADLAAYNHDQLVKRAQSIKAQPNVVAAQKRLDELKAKWQGRDDIPADIVAELKAIQAMPEKRELARINAEAQANLRKAEDWGTENLFTKDQLFDGYKRLAGEAEARNVQTRDAMRMRGEKPGRPWETQDVPDDQQIVRFGSGKAESRPKPPPKGQKAPPKGPGTLSRMVAGGAVGGLAGSLGGDANAQEDLTGKISQTEQTIADLKKAMADLDKITDPFEKQRFLKAQGYYAGKIDGDIAGKTTEGMERWKAKKEAELEKAEAERKDLVRRDALQSNRPDPLMMALREYGPAVLGIGALFGMKYMRGGAAKASIKTAEAASNKLNKLITKGPVTGAMNKRDENRFANLNKLWQKGGASKEELPFKQDGAGKYKPNAKAKLPEELFADSGVWQTVTKYVKGKDVAIILGGGLDVAIAQPFIDKANENLSKAEAAWNDTPSDETAKALEDAKNEVAAYTLLQRIGMGVAAGRILGTFGGAYAKPMPNIPAAASEQAKLKQFIVSQKPPPKPRAKATPPAPKPRPKPRPKPPAPPAVPPTSQLPLPLKGGGKKKP